MNRKLGRAAALAAVAVLALALAAVALAATPSDGSFGGKDMSLEVKGGKVTEITGGAGYKCNAIPLDIKKDLKVSKKGKFRYSGKVNNVTGDPEGKITITGRFKTAKKVVGKYKFVKKTCVSKHKFSATLGQSVQG